ncbi:hypothetical protein ACFY3G_17950 [Streptomyces phaeochromogenes]|uniref:hypothetical protein n=1 Tax=Streptomyces phaeochromogenes TaxID=1923 RepID=UPI003694C2B5
MTHITEEPALQPVESDTGALVHSRADRELATAQWLLSTLPEPDRSRARAHWAENKVALLNLGALFSAIRIPGRLVLALADTMVPTEADRFLSEALDGPVICDPKGIRYYALVPASTPRKWHRAVDDWRLLGVEMLGRDTFLGVPRMDAVEMDPRTSASYWSVPMSSAAMLCQPLNVARLIAAGRHQLFAGTDT